MARAATQQQERPFLPASVAAFLRRTAWRGLGLISLAIGLLLAAALISYDRLDPSFTTATDQAVRNWLGAPGAWTADFLLQTLGFATFALVPPPLAWALRLVRLKRLPWFWTHVLMIPCACLLLALALAAAAAGNGPADTGLGGIVGALSLSWLVQAAAALGQALPSLPVAVIAAGAGAAALLASLGIPLQEWRAGMDGLVRQSVRIARGLVGAVQAVRRVRGKAVAQRREPTAKPVPRKRKAPPKPATTAPVQVAAKAAKRADRSAQGSLFPAEDGFQLPALTLLTRATQADRAPEPEALQQNAQLLESVLQDFGIQGEIVAVRPGPVVTLYELEPARGTKSARVIGLADDIARSMSAVSARVAVIPGRNAIGIELPNQDRQTVHLTELLASAEFERSRAALPIIIGKEIGGAPVIADLASMPHLLVAGTTGSGKSVGLNAMILSLLYRLPPERCKFIMVDPKMLELSIYDGIPNLLTPVVTEAKKAVVALKWAVREMEERYRAMSRLGVRNITAFNKLVAEARSEGRPITRQVQTGFDEETGEPLYETQEFEFEALPLIVIVIDEMADLMLVAGKDVEATVQRLAQMARAAGLHLIMATQRPSVDVITGTIKANFPTRIAFQVTSKIDSRTILGEQGAEQLLGKGDCLFMAGGGRITRVHGAFVPDEDVEKVVKHLKKQGAPAYVEAVTEEPEGGFDSPFIPGPADEGGAGGSGASNEDSLYDKAVDVVLRDRRVSTSYIQRRLRIGYNKAASLIEEMEQQGVISAPNHAGKREVLVPEREAE
ncbi:MAG: DNA translocase FtsK 4TM domain-containing protein [Rhodothalassiaceae bacterium]